jgi:hypothetical protein
MNLSKTHQRAVGAVLMLLMVLTRSHHAATAVHLPDASWTVFFLAAVYLRSLWPFPVFALAAWLIDLAAVDLGGVSGFCMTPAYVALIPAYGALWLAGLWYARVHRDRLSTLWPLAGIFLLGVGVCDLFSSGGFYLFSGYFHHQSWGEYIARTREYLPSFLASASLYLGAAALIHVFARAFVRTEGEKSAGQGVKGRYAALARR